MPPTCRGTHRARADPPRRVGHLDRERDRLVLQLRFCRGRTQAEIGAELGISQMQVSRLLSRTLTRLRTGMLSK